MVFVALQFGGKGGRLSAGLGAGIAASVLVGSLFYSFTGPPARYNGKGKFYARYEAPDVGYTPVNKEPDLRGVKLAPLGSEMSTVQRAMRFGPITRLAEKNAAPDLRMTFWA